MPDALILAENVLGQMAGQQYVQNTVAHQDRYKIEPAYYPSLAKAKKGATARCSAQHA